MGLFHWNAVFAESWHIAWRSAPPLWVTILLIIPAVILISYLLYRREKTTAGTALKILLSLLRSRRW